jgi:tight adherence protein C
VDVLRNFAYRFFLANPQTIVLGAIFCSAVLMVLVVYLVLSKPKSIEGRLDRLIGPNSRLSNKNLSLLEGEAKGFSASVAKAVFKLVSNNEDDAKIKEKRVKLIQAGIRSQQAYRVFIASKFLLALVFPLPFFFYSASFSFSPLNILISGVTAMAGFLLPEIYVAHRREKRQELIIKGLPDALDLMVICVTAGLGLDVTINRVGTELQNVWPEISEEFFLTNLEVRAGLPRNECYKNMAWRTGVSDIQSLMTMIVQTNRFGTSVGDALRLYSDEMRTKRRQIAEEKAAKAAVKIMIPLVLFILPVIFIVIIGPAAIRVATTMLPALGGK